MDDTNTFSNLELTSTLDPLGFPLTRSTITSFFTRCGKKPHEDEIGIEQVVMCLEAELGKPDGKKKRLDADERQCNACDVRFWATWGGSRFGDLNKLDFSGPLPHVGGLKSGQEDKLLVPAPYVTEPMQPQKK